MNLHQFGIAEESTYGTYVAPTRFYEFLGGEALGRRQTVLNSQGLIRGDRFSRGSRRVLTKNDAGGTISFEVADVGFGLLFKHMLGAVATTQPDLVNDPQVFDHKFTAGDISAKSLTMQKGVEKTDGTVQAFSYHGCKIPNWEMTISVDAILNLNLTVDAEEESTAEALAVASYPDLELFHFGGATLEVDDAPVAIVSDASVSGGNSLKVDRYFLGQTGHKLAPREMDLRTLAGNLSAEFQNLTDFYNAFSQDTKKKLELIFLGSVLPGTTGFTRELRITLNDVRFTGETPRVEGIDVGVQSVPFAGFVPETGEAIEVLYRTTDATP